MKLFLYHLLLLYSTFITTTYANLWNYYFRFIDQSLSRLAADDIQPKDILDLSFSYPKTKWCGPGNTANGHNDLGEDWVTDMCCREHDECNEYIVPGSQKRGIRNTGSFAISGCECDNKFRECLNRAIASGQSTNTARVVANIYSIFSLNCIRTDPNTNFWSLIERKF